MGALKCYSTRYRPRVGEGEEDDRPHYRRVDAVMDFVAFAVAALLPQIAAVVARIHL